MQGLKAESGFGDIQEDEATGQVSNFGLEKEALTLVRKARSVRGRWVVSYNAPGGRLGKRWSGEKTQFTGGRCCCLHQEGFKVVPGVTDGVGGDRVREVDPDRWSCSP